MVDLKHTTDAIVRAARLELRSGPGQRCRLRDWGTVARLLVAVQAGFSQVRAAHCAGISRSMFRLWLQQGAAAETGPYRLLHDVVRAIVAERTPVAVEVMPAPAPVLASALVLVSPPMPVSPHPPMTPERITGLSEELTRLRVECSSLGPVEHYGPSEHRRAGEIRARLATIRAIVADVRTHADA